MCLHSSVPEAQYCIYKKWIPIYNLQSGKRNLTFKCMYEFPFCNLKKKVVLNTKDSFKDLPEKKQTPSKSTKAPISVVESCDWTVIYLSAPSAIYNTWPLLQPGGMTATLTEVKPRVEWHSVAATAGERACSRWHQSWRAEVKTDRWDACRRVTLRRAALLNSVFEAVGKQVCSCG